MRIITVIMSALLVAVGILPVFSAQLPFLSGPLYYVIVLGVGIIGLIATFMNVTMMGVSKVIASVIFAIPALAGLLSLIKFPLMPTGIIYSAIIIIAGIVGIIFGVKG